APRCARPLSRLDGTDHPGAAHGCTDARWSAGGASWNVRLADSAGELRESDDFRGPRGHGSGSARQGVQRRRERPRIAMRRIADHDMRTSFRAILLALALAAPAQLSGQGTYFPERGSWERRSPAQVGMNEDRL